MINCKCSLENEMTVRHITINEDSLEKKDAFIIRYVELYEALVPEETAGYSKICQFEIHRFDGTVNFIMGEVYVYYTLGKYHFVYDFSSDFEEYDSRRVKLFKRFVEESINWERMIKQQDVGFIAQFYCWLSSDGTKGNASFSNDMCDFTISLDEPKILKYYFSRFRKSYFSTEIGKTHFSIFMIYGNDKCGAVIGQFTCFHFEDLKGDYHIDTRCDIFPTKDKELLQLQRDLNNAFFETSDSWKFSNLHEVEEFEVNSKNEHGQLIVNGGKNENLLSIPTVG